MNELIIFALQLFVALAISVFVVYLIKPYLKDVLKDTCGTAQSAEFWVRFTQLMMIVSPLMIVVFFSVADPYQEGFSQPVQILKETMLQTLTGIFVGLVFVGRIIYRAINTSVEHARLDANLKITSAVTKA